MFKKKKVEKKIPDNTYRVIKISKEALYEFVYETFIENQEQFLDISDVTSVVHGFCMDWDDDSFTFVARTAKNDNDFFEEIDVPKISKAITDTTSTMFKQKRYIDLSQKQINDIQNS